MKVHPTNPFADGILFNDLWGMTLAQQNLLAVRGVVFATEFRHAGRTYGGNIVSTSMAGAEEIAFARGLGEEVVGVLQSVTPVR